MHGARLSLLVGGLVVILSLIMGISLGLFAGYIGGLVDVVIMRVVDIMLAVPSLLLALVLVAVFGPSVVNASIGAGLCGFTTLCAVDVHSSIIGNKS